MSYKLEIQMTGLSGIYCYNFISVLNTSSTLELIPLDLSGFVVDDRSHLPLVFYMVEGDYWRILMHPRGDDGYRWNIVTTMSAVGRL